MGSGMARNLLRAGHEVSIYNRTRSKAEALAAEGARIAESPADTARHCEAVITMLSDDPAAQETVLGESGIATTLPAGSVHISSSTISTALARSLALEHARRGQMFASAPVFGRPDAAESKKLIVIGGGTPEVIVRCRPIFDAIGRLTIIAGSEPWQANALKLCGNVMIASMIETFGETLALLEKAGVAPQAFVEAMQTLFGSPVYASYGKLLAEQRFEPAGFALKLGLKDVRLALETSFECAAPLPVAGLLRDQFLAAVAAGWSDADWSAISKIAARNSGL
jgi:3-hydroxyisobutyrate dehydrogenase-like beta-hydroxyacid dehydrogenase